MVVEEGVVLIFPPLIFEVVQEFLHILERLLPTQWCFRGIVQFKHSYCLLGGLPNGGGRVLLCWVVEGQEVPVLTAAEQEAQRKAEEEKHKAKEDAKQKAEEEEKWKAKEENKCRAKEEYRAQAEVKRKQKADMREAAEAFRVKVAQGEAQGVKPKPHWAASQHVPNEGIKG
ncbi:hypothetical protein SCLCIDRAFT_25391 [Scleroderma citrinum Foug A]|uniref:Uncharacterized protein n=1 Tax=Scleroderma citrinum Foug A TaxID=1036808 RepID=A0A0C3AAH5_9AGAM|nr:hypothetical protein SCLCIDRAFT_25391 [Scleroderma citrinum Foug A]